MTENGLDRPPKSVLTLSVKERGLIERLRRINFGRVVIFIEDHQPVRIDEISESVKL